MPERSNDLDFCFRHQETTFVCLCQDKNNGQVYFEKDIYTIVKCEWLNNFSTLLAKQIDKKKRNIHFFPKKNNTNSNISKI